MIVLQGTPLCNLNCTYCDLSPASRKLSHRMPIPMIGELFSQIKQLELLADEVSIVWHSGEPLSMPPEYYDEAIDLVLALNNDGAGTPARITFDFQTNATLIDHEWCEFFQRHRDHLRLGVSCDGPRELHDPLRVNWSGRGSHTQAVRGMDLLAERGIEFNAIAVVTAETLAQPQEFFDFFLARADDLTDFHFNILANHADGGPQIGYSRNDTRKYAEFYRTMLSLAQSAKGRNLPVRNFSQTLGRIRAATAPQPTEFLRAGTAPLRQLNCDARGEITTFYAGLKAEFLADLYGDGKGLSLGNIEEQTLAEMLGGHKLERMMDDFGKSHRHCAQTCDYYAMCPGGFELTQLVENGAFASGETTECVIHVKTLTDAVATFVSAQLRQPA
ncbi:hypothetical protein B2G71_23380 [Novosphingobium sp. PC22D]|uniref:radical SAM protein n=1 Tax=Novosphingobium sp. PC22D TaxID=1962403 RepID=UPI000BF0BB30|nr:radical SAM protein [Novosphingobium sp. PC22D]PEQ10241.1 hypothetical protein B2G71_23380 [Novosphingobium sp. PC22D]